MAASAAAQTSTSTSASASGTSATAVPGGSRAPVAPLLAGQAAPDASGRVSVWVDLDLPELATTPRDQPAEREALRLRIHTQQQAVMDRLLELGAVEQGRVQLVRNALAVRLPGAQMAAARAIPGVRAVRPVRHVERGPLVRGR